MNRKIYYNDKFIEFVHGELQETQNQMVKVYDNLEDDTQIEKIVQDFTDEKNKHSIILLNQSFDKTFEELKKHFHYIEAAGGFIEKDNEFLCIHRQGRWDLPKGKLEKGETVQEAGVRECEEECGIKKLTIIRPMNSTFHVYVHKKGFALKQSYWFYMRSTYDKKLKAQTEENIDEVKWFSKDDIISVVLKDTYYTISDVINEGLKINSLLN